MFMLSLTCLWYASVWPLWEEPYMCSFFIIIIYLHLYCRWRSNDQEWKGWSKLTSLIRPHCCGFQCHKPQCVFLYLRVTIDVCFLSISESAVQHCLNFRFIIHFKVLVQKNNTFKNEVYLYYLTVYEMNRKSNKVQLNAVHKTQNAQS